MNDDSNNDWAAVGVHVMCNDQVDWEYARAYYYEDASMMRKFVSLFAVVLLAVSFAAEAQVPDRRWIVQTSDGKLIGFTDDQDVDPPDATFATFVLESVIRAVDPPGATGEILPLGTWISGVYTAPSGGGIVVHIDPTIGHRWKCKPRATEHAGRVRLSPLPTSMKTVSPGRQRLSPMLLRASVGKSSTLLG